jgi:guanylate kinase
MPPSLEALESRLRGRGTEDEASVQKRLGKAVQELKAAQAFDVQLVNDDLEKAFRRRPNLSRISFNLTQSDP